MSKTWRPIAEFNRTKTDRFLDVLIAQRADLANLPFLRGDACRLKKGGASAFKRATHSVRTGLLKPESFWTDYPRAVTEEPRKIDGYDEKALAQARIRALTQILAVESIGVRKGLVAELARTPDPEATRALARFAIFSQDEVRRSAVTALATRPYREIVEVFAQGVHYPWPPVAEQTADAVIQLKRLKPVVAAELLPRFIDLLDSPDPRDPQLQHVGGKMVPVVRELVRLNHHRNCMLCHAPARAAEVSELITGAVPDPRAPLPSSPLEYCSSLENLVRGDVTYLRQDFSLLQPVEKAAPWPKMQRFDFLVRTRTLTDKEAAAYREIIANRPADYQSPYHRLALSVLRDWSGEDMGTDANAWRNLLGAEK